MTEKSPSTLINFFIFNTTLGQEEGTEHEKILFYYPDADNIDKQSRSVGLSEAIVHFCGTFAPDRPCEVVQTLKSRQVFYQPEENFWMIMAPSEVTNKDGNNIVYHQDEVQDQALQSILMLSYKIFRLFNGPFSMTFNESVDSCRELLKHFFTRFIKSIKLAQQDLQDVLQGIRFLPLGKQQFLKVQQFINLIEANFSNITYAQLLFDDQLIWSSLDLDHTQILYGYLTTNLLPNHQEAENIKDQNSKDSKSVIYNLDVQGKFITGPTELGHAASIGKIPRIFINKDGKWEIFAVIVYKVLDTVLCMLVKYDTIFPTSTSTIDFFRKLDKFIGPQIKQLTFDIAEQNIINRRLSLTEMQYRFIYFNHMNCAFKSSIYPKINQPAIIGPDLMRLFYDIHAEFDKSKSNEEFLAKTATDCWVVGKIADQRELFVAQNLKNGSLLDINDEMKKLVGSLFGNIFYFNS
ncbi:Vacuolar fusion protein CCZ1-like protein [Trichoplax sp. H2]|nr:Vacuolar fusion protein CCZ1-like protein [Trichoplax sp. H2]|eukprot:RDD36569.1 Vacuolar fusion protein CCZ1-like protein [Trichoplax sp. H2]